MIVIGYQGIGKSTISHASKGNFIDLESGNFWVDGKRDPEWFKPYCQIALHLHKQGYVVFTSSHEVVRNYFHEIAGEDEAFIYVCYPAPDLKDDWIAKLQLRYHRTGKDKDYKALMNAKDRYTENIHELAYSGFNVIEINDIQYDLKSLLEAACIHADFADED